MIILCYAIISLLFFVSAHSQQVVVSAGVTWISPSPGHTFNVGQPIELTWAANQTSHPESFRLCVTHADGSLPPHMDLNPVPANDTSPHIDIGSIGRIERKPERREAATYQVTCGKRVWADVQHANGTFSLAFLAPNATSSSLCYVQMFSESGGTLASPLFKIQEYTSLYSHGRLSKIVALTIVVPVCFALLIALAACFSATRQCLRVRAMSKATKSASPSRIILDDPFLAKHTAVHLPPVDRDSPKPSLTFPNWYPKLFHRSAPSNGALDLEKSLAQVVSAEVTMQLEKRDSFTTTPKRETRHGLKWAPPQTAILTDDGRSVNSQSTTSTFVSADICQAEPAHIQQPRLALTPTYLLGPLSLSPVEEEDEVNDSIIASYMAPPLPNKDFSLPVLAPVRRECLPRNLTSGALIPPDPVQMRICTSGQFMIPGQALSPTSGEEQDIYNRVQRALALPSPHAHV